MANLLVNDDLTTAKARVVGVRVRRSDKPGRHTDPMARPATRNLGRLSEIAQVLVRHGFGYMFERHRLTDILPWRERAAPLDGQPSSRGRALREALDELGPTFVKFGQLL